MRFYENEVVKQVRASREKGESIKGLVRRFGIPHTTIARWVHDIASENMQFKEARRRDEERKRQFRTIAENFPLDVSTAKLLVSLLYWCEGSKHPGVNGLQFANSDWRLVKSFLSLLRQAFPIDETKLRAYLQIHDTHNHKDLLKFWTRVLDIPESQFYRPTITSPKHKMKRRDYLGTCTVKYFDVALLLSITGIYERFAERLD